MDNKLKQAIRVGLCVGPLSEAVERTYSEVTELLLKEHERFIKKQKAAGLPHETADYQIKEFIEHLTTELEEV